MAWWQVGCQAITQNAGVMEVQHHSPRSTIFGIMRKLQSSPTTIATVCIPYGKLKQSVPPPKDPTPSKKHKTSEREDEAEDEAMDEEEVEL
ncbi:hypothetical protein N7517_004504 [Penicillium concentricum]|uniref:Uncharacterized protein n=1 Tax=Penicillium concentricum TaxID=293559 RepID=A0A9W9S5N5_9EURO|nr:uncharacterized protein N7517_004504 [Penicillium concentricum]KAJ5372498.1 hypothetical protein N7517_004504 [Penicillium concentricum]